MIQTISGKQPAIRKKLSLLAYFLLAVASSLGARSAPTVGDQCFHIFDATLFSEKPDLSVDGLEPSNVVDPHQWIKTSEARGQIPSESSIRDGLSANRPRSTILVLDAEDWPDKGTAAEVRASVDNYLTLLSRARHVGVKALVGFYGVPPVRDYWRAIDPPNAQTYQGWQSSNDLLQPLADAVDALFPSIYTFYADEDGWKRYATANLSEARRLARGKPVYAFIWPQYHDSNKDLRLKFIPGEFWALQLQTVAKHADGAIIWGGWHRVWDEQAEWWKATREFIRTQPHLCSAPKPPTNIEARP